MRLPAHAHAVATWPAAHPYALAWRRVWWRWRWCVRGGNLHVVLHLGTGTPHGMAYVRMLVSDTTHIPRKAIGQHMPACLSRPPGGPPHLRWPRMWLARLARRSALGAGRASSELLSARSTSDATQPNTSGPADAVHGFCSSASCRGGGEPRQQDTHLCGRGPHTNCYLQQSLRLQPSRGHMQLASRKDQIRAAARHASFWHIPYRMHACSRPPPSPPPHTPLKHVPHACM